MKPSSNIKLAFALNLLFALVEFVGAFFTNSVAIAADAVHDLGDSLAIGLAWYLDRLSQTGKDERFSFGYKRFSLLGALINCLILIVGSLFILRETLPRLWHPEPVHSQGMIWLALAGIAFNGFAAFRLYHHGHSLSEEVLSLHFLEDVLGWVAVLATAIAIQIGDFAWLDPLLSLGIALWIIWNAGKRLRKTLVIFLQAIPEDLNLGEIEQSMTLQPAVLAVHDVHLWSLDGRHHVLSAHLVVRSDLSPTELKALRSKVRSELRPMGIDQVTLELDHEL